MRKNKKQREQMQEEEQVLSSSDREIYENPLDLDVLRENIIIALRTIYDPEIPVNIYDLGLIYNVDVNEEGKVHIQMTLTSPGCPVAQTFPGTVESEINKVENVVDCVVELVWDPPWTQERMTEAAKLELGFL